MTIAVETIREQLVAELGATLNAALVVIGDRLGLYQALAGAGPLTPRELAERTDVHERYVREWLNAQAAGGYVTYEDGRYALPDEHAVALDELSGAFRTVVGVVRGEHGGHDLFGDDLAPWIETLGPGARDGELGTAPLEPGAGYDRITALHCLHDLPDPVGTARRVRQALAPDGVFLIVEPFAGDSVEENLTPLGRIYYAISTLECVRASTAHALGAQAGEARLRDVVTAAGFTRFRRVAATPFNLVLEARP